VVTFTATYTGTAEDAGKTISIFLSSNDQGNFDNVRLDALGGTDERPFYDCCSSRERPRSSQLPSPGYGSGWTGSDAALRSSLAPSTIGGDIDYAIR
jgi:hypothetical protein